MKHRAFVLGLAAAALVLTAIPLAMGFLEPTAPAQTLDLTSVLAPAHR